MESEAIEKNSLLHTQEVTGSSPVAPTTSQGLTGEDRRSQSDRPPEYPQKDPLFGRYLAGDAQPSKLRVAGSSPAAPTITPEELAQYPGVDFGAPPPEPQLGGFSGQQLASENREARRHSMLFLLSEEFLLDVLAGRCRVSNLPEGYKLLSVSYDYERGCFAVRVQHHSFALVPTFQTFPVFEAEVSRG